MKVGQFAKTVFELVAHAPIYSGKTVYADMIANPAAGGFTRKLFFERHLKDLSESQKYAQEELDRAATLVGRNLFLTRRPRHSIEIAQRIIDASKYDEPGSERLIITAGGDGTSLEVQECLLAVPKEVRKRITIFRLPMGTGNDGADGRTLPEALSLLTGPASFETMCALELKPKGMESLFAFNIASLGLDAFVTHMTNKLKGKVPGDSYKFWVDLASVLYDILYKVAPMKVEAINAAGEKKSFERATIMMAMGVSGCRSYGSGVRILPDERNCCAVNQMGLLRKLAIKGRLTKGEHASFPEVDLFSADSLTIDYEYPILAQTDGESYHLTKDNFPLTIKKTEPMIRILKKVTA